MASVELINRIKYNRHLYSFYFRIGSLLVNFLKVFLRSRDNLILFSSFSGKRFDDSPKEIYEAMIKDHRFDKYDIVWAFRDMDKYNLPRGSKVKIDTIKYFKTAIRARIWVTNVSMTRGLDFTGKNTFFLNTWHGTAIKHIGTDVERGKETFKSKSKSKTDIYLAQGEHDVKIFSHAFDTPITHIAKIGLPRNDGLVNGNSKENIDKLKEKIGIPFKKKVILYAPTYREYEKDQNNNVILKPPFDIDKWKKRLGNNFVLLFRAHQEVVNILNLKEDDFVKNVSAYPLINELMLVSDLLISDYSSIVFDYSILSRPILCYTYDYDRYVQERGVYFDIRKELPSETNENKLLNLIAEGDYDELSLITTKFRDKYVTEYGNAAQKALDLIHDAI